MQHALRVARMPFALKSIPAKHGVRAVPMHPAMDAMSMQDDPQKAHIAQNAHIERVLRCRKCFRSGSATWESTSTGGRALLALSDGFHRRARVPLSLPP